MFNIFPRFLSEKILNFKFVELNTDNLFKKIKIKNKNYQISLTEIYMNFSFINL